VSFLSLLVKQRKMSGGKGGGGVKKNYMNQKNKRLKIQLALFLPSLHNTKVGLSLNEWA
jgi:hypothetical protein